MALLELKVKPERTRRKPNGDYALRSPLAQRWWHHADKRPALYAAISGSNRVLVLSRVRATGFVFLDSQVVVSEQIIAFSLQSMRAFSSL
ncbi:MAG: hypothetical protein ACK55I_43680, partial [bacterium]